MRAGRPHSVFRGVMPILITVLCLMQPAWAQNRDLESAVKATFLMRFPSFVQWPPESFPGATDPVVLCVTGDPAFAGLVESAARGERIGVRSIVVRSIGPASPSSGCHVLYTGGGQDAAARLAAMRGEPVLTVTDERRGSARGMIHFVMDNGRVRFHADRAQMEAAGLAVSARLLNVALTVRGRRGQ